MNRVLVVDDDIASRLLLALQLGKAGYAVVEAEGGEAALEALSTAGVDLVLLDQMMPGMDGMATLKIIKERYPSLPVIMMTAFSSVRLAVEFMAAGGAYFVEKPIDIDVLNLKIQRVLTLAQSKSGEEPEENVSERQAVEKVSREETVVVVIDFNETRAELVARRLEKLGFEVYTAANRTAEIQRTIEIHPDLILVNMHMPGTDGYEVTRSLRRQGYRGLIVALTRSKMVLDVAKSTTTEPKMVLDYEKALDVGCNHYINAPISFNFENTIKDFLEEAQKKKKQNFGSER